MNDIRVLTTDTEAEKYEPRHLFVGDKQYVVVDPEKVLAVDPDDSEVIGLLEMEMANRMGWQVQQLSRQRSEAIAYAVRQLLPQPSPVRPPEPADVPSTVTDIHGVQWVKFRYDTSGNKVTWISSESQFSKYDDIEVV